MKIVSGISEAIHLGHVVSENAPWSIFFSASSIKDWTSVDIFQISFDDFFYLAVFANPASFSKKQIIKWNLQYIYIYSISTTCAPRVFISGGFPILYYPVFVNGIYFASAASYSVLYHTFTLSTLFNSLFFTSSLAI